MSGHPESRSLFSDMFVFVFDPPSELDLESCRIQKTVNETKIYQRWKKDVLAPPTWRRRVSSWKTLGTPDSPPTVSAAHQKLLLKEKVSETQQQQQSEARKKQEMSYRHLFPSQPFITDRLAAAVWEINWNNVWQWRHNTPECPSGQQKNNENEQTAEPLPKNFLINTFKIWI